MIMSQSCWLRINVIDCGIKVDRNNLHASVHPPSDLFCSLFPSLSCLPQNLMLACTQARNQFGTPGGGEEFSKRGPNFLTMSSF